MRIKCGETELEVDVMPTEVEILLDVVKEIELKRIRTLRDAKIKIKTQK